MRAGSSALPSVAQTLSYPEIAAGDPQIRTAPQALDRQVRWAHVVAGADAVRFLDGGELVLTTGAGWPSDPRKLDALAEALAAAGPAAILLELGQFYDEPPPTLVRACERHGVPLVTLGTSVRFVQITQRVHQQILAAQHEALAARAEVHAMLTELGLNRSPVDYVVERLADTLGCVVVLEDSAHRVIAWAGTGFGSDSDDPLAAWGKAGGPGDDVPAGWARVPVEAQGRRWGHLTALPGPKHPAGRRTVLELGAFALALGRLADPAGDQWLRYSSKHMFDVLLGGRFRRDHELATQLAAHGLPIDGRQLLGATLRGVGVSGLAADDELALLDTALRRAVSPEGRVILAPDTGGESLRSTGGRAGAGSTVLIAALSFPAGDPRVATHDAPVPPLATRLARELESLLPHGVPAAWQAHLALGATGSRVRGLITSLERVRAAGAIETGARVGRVSVTQAEQQPLAYLVRGIAAAPEVQEFAAQTLGALVAHDEAAGPGHSGDLLLVLQAYLDHPTNRSRAAQAARLSRTVFYQRLALIEELLGVDLADGATIATLTVALLARG